MKAFELAGQSGKKAGLVGSRRAISFGISRSQMLFPNPDACYNVSSSFQVLTFFPGSPAFMVLNLILSNHP